MKTLEADLYPAVKAWLEALGFKAYPEVSFQYSSIDVVAISDCDVWGIEMKRCLTGSVIRQAATRQIACDRVYVAVGSKPRDISRPVDLGIGVLRVKDGQVEVLAEAKSQGRPVDTYLQILRTKCRHHTGEGVGGVPSMAGNGPAQECKRRVEAYLKGHPAAGWKELFENVPNHYAHAKSMQGALVRGLRLRDELKERRKRFREKAANKGKAT